MSVSILYLLQILVSAFLAILFLQSGIDKIVDRQGNLEWLKGHFAKSPLAGTVPLLFAALTILEVAAGLLSGIGFLALIFAHSLTIAFYGSVTSEFAIVASYKISPPMMAISLRVYKISGSGIFMMSCESTVKSASLPTSIEPFSFSSKAA